MDTEKLGKYRLLSLIATGGMGEVFLARQEGPAGFSKTVVIKRILRHLADDQGFIDMFLNEARLAAQLQHPNIAQIFGLEHESDTWFIAMEHVHGRSCRACLTEARKRSVRFPPRIAARICAQALQGLQFAHRLTDEGGRPLGILHRDVSPDNVLVSFSGAVKLVDFGIAKAMTRSFTFNGRLKGKFAYMAPEQFVSGATIDARIDLYAMGVLLHELVTLELPANVPKSPDQALLSRAPWTPHPDLPAELNAILDKALQSDPAQRWESADAFAHALEEFIAVSGEPLTAAHVAGFLEEVFGREVVMTNPSVATMEPAPLGGGRTDVLPAIKGPVVPPAGDLWASSPTVIEPALQGQQQLGTRSGPDMVAVPVATPPDLRWPYAVAAGTLAVVLLGFGVWTIVGSTPEPVGAGPAVRVVPPLKLAASPDPAPKVTVAPAPVEPWVDAGAPAIAVVPDQPAEPPRPKIKRRPPPPRPGRVTVRVNPWAEVFFNGKSYGITPLKHAIEVPAGNVTFTLKNPQLGVNRKVTVRVAAGGEVVLKADLFKK
ncbi:MAG: serine/threonine protein kinase [Myxococcaceae bacterium]|nr:serine/threonine protein kinase [Myxococcaceae bacterium]